MEDLNEPALQPVAFEYPTGLSWALVNAIHIDSGSSEPAAIAEPPLTDPFQAARLGQVLAANRAQVITMLGKPTAWKHGYIRAVYAADGLQDMYVDNP